MDPGLNKSRINRLLEIIVGLALVVVVIFIVSATVRISRGVSRTLEMPQYQVRLQILNGCSVKKIASQASQVIRETENDELDIQIVALGDFNLTTVKKTILIVRNDNKEAAVQLAEYLGLDPRDNVFKPLEDNRQHITATLVLGEDYSKLSLNLPTENGG